jgi:Spx/MgsR family transcriptional regulator
MFNMAAIVPLVISPTWPAGHFSDNGTMTILYGIPNCDTVKKARAWLTEHGVEHTFHDFRKQGVPEADLHRWLATAGWEKLVNRKGTTWRGLDETLRASVVDAASARAVLLAHASVIKRPVVVWADGQITVGFDAADWAQRARATPPA